MKLTRVCISRPPIEREPAALTIDDARNPAMPWLRAHEPYDDFEDIEYARSWAYDHPPVETIGAIHAFAAPAPRAQQPAAHQVET